MSVWKIGVMIGISLLLLAIHGTGQEQRSCEEQLLIEQKKSAWLQNENTQNVGHIATLWARVETLSKQIAALKKPDPPPAPPEEKKD